MASPNLKWAALTLCCLWLAWPVSAQAPLPLMETPASYTDVIDAFDGDDPLDVNLSASFLRSATSGTIQRETSVAGTDGMPEPALVEVATHRRVTNTLRLGADVGLYKDLALSFVLPIVLRESRELSSIPGADLSVLDDPPPLSMNDNDALFSVPFKAPPRSGVPALGFGLAWAPINQHRVRTLPTWVLRAEMRLGLGDVMRARRACRMGEKDPCANPGVSDGTSALRLESRTSYRFRFIEPYLGLALELPWVSTGTELYGSDLEALVNKQPPWTGELTMGAALIPWEDREHFQRVSFDLRATGEYISEGRGISPLFDALGSSSNEYLTAPNYERLLPGARQVHMTGVTDMSAHARVGIRVAAVIQAAKYIRFAVGFGLAHSTAYWLTGTDACNPNIVALDGDPRRGSCPDVALNPAHRPVIDLVGKRFRLDGETTFDLFSSATAQF